MPAFVFATYDAAFLHPALIVEAAVATDDENFVTASICEYAVSALPPDQLAKTVRDRVVRDPASDVISVSTFIHSAPRPVSLSSSARGNFPLTTESGMSGDVYWVIMRVTLRSPDRCSSPRC